MTGKERILAMLPRRAHRFAAADADHHDVRGRPGRRALRDYARDHRVLAEAQLRTAETLRLRLRLGHLRSGARGVATWARPSSGSTTSRRRSWRAARCSPTRRKLDRSAPSRSVQRRRMHDRVEAVRLLAERPGETRIVEGWVEGPCAMSADLRGLNTLMLDFFDDPAVRAKRCSNSPCAWKWSSRGRRSRPARPDRRRRRGGLADRAEALRRIRAALREAPGRRDPARLACPCGCTSAATPKRIVTGMGQTGADIIDLDFPTPLAEARAAMAQRRCCSAISTRCATCATARRNPWKRCWPSAIARPVRPTFAARLRGAAGHARRQRGRHDALRAQPVVMASAVDSYS